ncbi:type VI secretion system baseplate subunit TssF [Massilia agilis]|uniref:Type VI secretion system baseplate subunit TssF n=1 Tax=Massilia agilis TaxID=1811226 RepID=A0ABT2DB73_9BURK|nr:type VI secretion system baseplate subunit TssF [Massilia agilis]MCS0808561.1 type VI secretion system baseplate subunit TssF [Massilia agilis]
MDELFAKYERELVNLRSLCREYAQRYPKVAAKLQMGGEACDDPHVERLIQAVALLCARVTKRLDDSYPEFTEALLNQLFPHFLRPFPSCAIVRFFGEPDAHGQVAPIAEVPRGTLLETAPVRDVPCRFKTVYEVAPGGVRVAAASFESMICAPAATRLPEGAASSLTLVLESSRPGVPLSAKESDTVRLYVDGDSSFCATLRDVLFIHTAGAYLQVGEDGPWQPLPAVPIKPVGFADDEGLIPFRAKSHAAYRILAEYFAFPEKFNFFDIDLPAVLARVPEGCSRVTLRLAVADVPPDSDKARMLANLSAENLLPGCTPVVNLFSQPGVPITYDQVSSDYTLLAHGAFPQAFEVYSVDKVHMVRQSGNGTASAVEFRPFYSMRHGEEVDVPKGRYWLMRHDETLAITSPGHEKSITLVNSDCDPLQIERNTLSVELTCTNRDLPCSVKVGASEGDLFVPGAARSDVIRFLRRPTRPLRLMKGADSDWRLISHLALDHHLLLEEGAAGLREMLALYDLAQTPVSRRQIGGIVGFEQNETTAWIRHKRGASLAHGVELRLTLDEEAFVGAGLHLFAQVLDHFFGLYVYVNSFVELVVLSHQSGKELFRCLPRSGYMPLV